MPKSVPIALFNAPSILNCAYCTCTKRQQFNSDYKFTNRIFFFPGSCIVALLKAVAIQSSKDACYEQMELYNGNKFTEHLFQQDCKFM